LKNLESLHAKYKNKGKDIMVKIERLVKGETTLLYGDTFSLRSVGAKVFVSRDSNSYPTLSMTLPIHLKAQREQVNDDNSVHYGMSYSYYLISSDKPGHRMCMSPNNWYVFWAPNATAIGDKNCFWSICSVKNSKKKDLSYGDKVLIYNRGYSHYIIGVSKDRKWLEDIPVEKGTNADHQWFVGKRM
jgi:hypothetical protein